ncbi:MAG TPA: ABC transporter permease [Jatrophihabitans sp.]|nr:ABC transporter permease [Jatrophihabitans sp.]
MTPVNDFTDGAWNFITTHVNLVLSDLGTHLVLSAESVAIAIVLGVPLGVWLGHIHRFSFLAINISNLGRALPSLAILAILLPYTGVGQLDVVIALVILAFPPILTNSYVAVEQVDADTVDAARGNGLTPLQVLTKVELPLALPLIFAGIRTSAVFVVATATLAGIFGGGGLGDIINNRESYGLNGIIAASYILIVLAFLVQIAFLGLEWLVTPPGLRVSRVKRSRRRGGAPGWPSPADLPDEHADRDRGEEGAASEDALAATRPRPGL